MTSPKTIRQLIQANKSSFTPSERKLVKLLTGAKPILALGTIHELANHAHVSAPTVLRFAVKLGYSGFPEFQKAWLNELELKLSSPLTMINQPHEDEAHTFSKGLGSMVEDAIAELSAGFDLVKLLSDSRQRVYVRGGRFSQTLAEYLYAHLKEMRGNTEILGRIPAHDLDTIVDIGKKDILIAFDYRRYQEDTVRLARLAAEQGAQIVLFTDKWLSPISELTNNVVISDISSGSAYDSLVPAMAQLEYLSMLLLKELGETASTRLKRLEVIRSYGRD
ncbi:MULTISPECIES: MurR/RpiR family transcriptional regulator [Pseudomonas]|uniref:MurR/RpiR family transcriptional regulator n=1 Tax=Pseudomonas urmiensis TaxID=2745493 RepID=A0A923FVI8_9PSED|nr:MurR/RpiR family transcriptional regulator [Pseudomonas urmiensis]MBV4535700.1 MurR/RpiR family transcriptional regulator [Pseudomonas urmiensis]HEN8731759.1 MurR/RpiR family transcriptional regulator [Pseudomonas putida]